MTDVQPTRIVEHAADDLRPLAAFLDLCLPLDRSNRMLSPAPAPEPSPGDLLSALDRAIAHEVRRGHLIQFATQRVVDVNTGAEWDEPVYTMACERCQKRPVARVGQAHCESCAELLADIAAAHDWHSEINDYRCEGEAA